MPYKDRSKQSAYQNQWLKARREAWLQENGPCRRCSSWNGLQVDHIDPSQKVSHRIWSWSEERRQKELEKCQPLCCACHQNKTIKQTYAVPIHGTITMYKGHGCRCRACRAVNAIRKRIWKIGCSDLSLIRLLSGQLQLREIVVDLRAGSGNFPRRKKLTHLLDAHSEVDALLYFYQPLFFLLYCYGPKRRLSWMKLPLYAAKSLCRRVRAVQVCVLATVCGIVLQSVH